MSRQVREREEEQTKSPEIKKNSLRNMNQSGLNKTPKTSNTWGLVGLPII